MRWLVEESVNAEMGLECPVFISRFKSDVAVE